MPQGASAPRGTAQVPHNAQIGGGSDCEVWMKTHKEFQTSLNLNYQKVAKMEFCKWI